MIRPTSARPSMPIKETQSEGHRVALAGTLTTHEDFTKLRTLLPSPKEGETMSEGILLARTQYDAEGTLEVLFVQAGQIILPAYEAQLTIRYPHRDDAQIEQIILRDLVVGEEKRTQEEALKQLLSCIAPEFMIDDVPVFRYTQIGESENAHPFGWYHSKTGEFERYSTKPHTPRERWLPQPHAEPIAE